MRLAASALAMISYCSYPRALRLKAPSASSRALCSFRASSVSFATGKNCASVSRSKPNSIAAPTHPRKKTSLRFEKSLSHSQRRVRAYRRKGQQTVRKGGERGYNRESVGLIGNENEIAHLWGIAERYARDKAFSETWPSGEPQLQRK